MNQCPVCGYKETNENVISHVHMNRYVLVDDSGKPILNKDEKPVISVYSSNDTKITNKLGIWMKEMIKPEEKEKPVTGTSSNIPQQRELKISNVPNPEAQLKAAKLQNTSTQA